jgi:hypothetical protein
LLVHTLQCGLVDTGRAFRCRRRWKTVPPLPVEIDPRLGWCGGVWGHGEPGDVERWAEPRREHFVRGVLIKELMRRTGLARNTFRVALRSREPPAFRCPERPSKLDQFKEEMHALLAGNARISGVRVRELIEPLGSDGSKTIVDDYLREVRPLFLTARTHQRAVYRPGEI